ncbi:hypothetical protein [Sediminitomix flava]|uniref:Lipoprotein n=1 Tax=Sediminitomix flava TaxID=379075 RepID=A0A315ZF30_SEDFL|nr:hypothetical protein [Sediminitomix flava]PWJ43783.1 hypothetical protein BC781_101129 [Sediminitomix flava]
MKARTNLFYTLLIFLMGGCYSFQWSKPKEEQFLPPTSVFEVFKKHPNSILKLEALSPGYDYKYDIGEKAPEYSKDKQELRFTSVELKLAEKMPRGKVLVDLIFSDQKNNQVLIPKVDLLKLIPKIDAKDKMQYPELLLEEFNRFGLTFRSEHDEFDFCMSTGEEHTLCNGAYRCSVTNNCLKGGKWEFALTYEDYSDFSDRLKQGINLNQNRILAHSWFYMNQELYKVLFQLKNPNQKVDLDMGYDSLSNFSEENVLIDFEKLRNPIRYPLKTKIIEVGHQSEKKLEPLDVEEFYKNEFGLIVSGQKYAEETYASILNDTVKLAQFKDRGFYDETTPKICDFSWMKHMDDVKIDVIDVKGSEGYVQLKLTGEWSPYEITIGNVDLALINEQKLYGLLFGINTYPKSRRHNPVQNTISYDPELISNEKKQYVLMTDKKTGKWVNNQYKAVEKIYLSYESLEHDILDVYVLSYERIMPVWMAKVKLPRHIREQIRIRKRLYNY